MLFKGINNKLRPQSLDLHQFLSVPFYFLSTSLTFFAFFPNLSQQNMIVCVAVVGHQNNPLYLQSFTGSDDALKLHHIVHCSLDVIDERVNNPKRSASTLNETFLGLLYPTENYKVYGYLTNTKVKFIMVTTDLDVKDADVRSFFRKFHAAYVDAVCNPFHVPGKKITSNSFSERVGAIVRSFGPSMTL
ncbi:Trafficking protein particle complex subunit 2-like protein [Rhynchospora pubera]|uniref:Trafficking protein particle complex subunit n=1 Tax=Rhynchospora pubera TaxID=906938 RepID=A0AAV8F5H0_9POAL|nr:Trafficking protein particle complex subunit 2-like protein [Rhynchospora pubera]